MLEKQIQAKIQFMLANIFDYKSTEFHIDIISLMAQLSRPSSCLLFLYITIYGLSITIDLIDGYPSRCYSEGFNYGKMASAQIQKEIQTFQQYMNRYHPQKVVFQLRSSGNQNRFTKDEGLAYRQKIFYNNFNTIKQHNIEGMNKFQMGLNEFTLYQEEEFTKIYASGFVIPQRKYITRPNPNFRYQIDKLERRLQRLYFELKQLKKLQKLEKNLLYKDQVNLEQRRTKSSVINSQEPLNITQPTQVQNLDSIPSIYGPINKNAQSRISEIVADQLFNLTIDWSCKVSNLYINNQGACGSCYAFATLDAFYIALKLNNSDIPQYYFSAQEILSCAKNDITLFGCKGGYFSGVYEYIKYKGVGYSILYQYSREAQVEGKNVSCLLEKLPQLYRSKKIYLKGYKQVPYNDCISLMETLKAQPLAVAISTTQFQFYKNGTFTTTSSLINHGVTLIGYYSDRGYLIKNSWGNTWGNSGYGFVDQTTGICKYGVAPIL